jgi:Na+-translocating ferredoxin:NAD+ oxidoreductase RnfG subunit
VLLLQCSDHTCCQGCRQCSHSATEAAAVVSAAAAVLVVVAVAAAAIIAATAAAIHIFVAAAIAEPVRPARSRCLQAALPQQLAHQECAASCLTLLPSQLAERAWPSAGNTAAAQLIQSHEQTAAAGGATAVDTAANTQATVGCELVCSSAVVAATVRYRLAAVTAAAVPTSATVSAAAV